MYVLPQIDLSARDSAIDPRTRSILWQGSKTTPRYQVRIWLEGNDLPFVQDVTYTLHSSFAQPVHLVPRTPRNPNCELTFWTWGVFEVAITIRDKRGKLYDLRHTLAYNREFQQPGIRFVQEKEPPRSVPQLRF